MLARVCIAAFACALLSSPYFFGSAGEKKQAEDLSELKVRLRLNAIESSRLMDHYAALFARELGLQDSVRACIKSGDDRLPQYQQALNQARADLEQTKKKLSALESEKTKLIERLGAKNAAEATLDRLESVNRVLDRILERLGSLEKRLEKLERQR